MSLFRKMMNLLIGKHEHRMTGELKIYQDPEILADKVSDWLIESIANAKGNRFDLAISGGSTPNLLFRSLAAKFPDSKLWSKTHFWWVDERMVPSSDPESNFGTARKLLFSKIQIPETNIHPILGESIPEAEAERYSKLIRKELKMKESWPLFDLIFLGMGEDGHTASLFPNHPELLVSDKICEIAYHPVSQQTRITLTGKPLNNAEVVCFLVTGRNKAELLHKILANEPESSSLPAANIHPVHGKLYWLADKSAAL
jgi:6-phosphogluconolactonase